MQPVRLFRFSSPSPHPPCRRIRTRALLPFFSCGKDDERELDGEDRRGSVDGPRAEMKIKKLRAPAEAQRTILRAGAHKMSRALLCRLTL